jgi:ATP-dependent RNA helicase DeaD
MLWNDDHTLPARDEAPNEAAEPASAMAGAREDPAETAPNPFAAFGLSPESLRAIDDLGFVVPTPIQDQTIRLLLAGRDVIAQAPTGTGKTAAFGLPIVEGIDVGELYPQALVVAPTRELAMQDSEALHALGKYREVVTLPIYGGAPYDRQLRALARGVQVVVGTPGRLLDHLRRGTLDLSHVRYVVLDEADEMLDMGFIEDIEAILAALPEERQGALFSATIPPRVARLGERFLRQPERVSVAAKEAVAPKVRQVYYEVPWPEKVEALARILDYEQPDSAMVFVRTRRDADEVAERLNGLGYLAQPIHGDLNQAQRERTLGRFRAGRTQLLVATDVAARGLDIPDVSHVINFDLPEDADQYVHRIGRTGRAGRSGEALTLVTPRERRQLMTIERLIHRRLERLRLPTDADVATRRREVLRNELMSVLDGGQLDPYISVVSDLAETRDPVELAAAAFKLAALARESATGRTARGRAGVPAPTRPGAPARAPSAPLAPMAPRTVDAAPVPTPSTPEPVAEAVPSAPEVSPAPEVPPAKTARRDRGDVERGERDGDQLAGEGAKRPREGRRGAETRVGRDESPGRGGRAAREDRWVREEPEDRRVSGAAEGWRTPPIDQDDDEMARLFLRVGRRDKVRPADLVGAVANEANIPGEDVGDIDIYDTFSFVEVPAASADRVLRALNQTTIRGREVHATLARPMEDEAWRDDERRSVRPLRAPIWPRRGVDERRSSGPRHGPGRTSFGRPPANRAPFGRPPADRPRFGKRDRGR